MLFLESVIASILGGIILLALLPLISRKAKELYITALSRFLDLDLTYVYKNKDDAKEYLKKEVSEARYLKVMTARGNDFQQDAFEAVLDDRKQYDEIKILFPNPFNHIGIDWFQHREQELKVFDSSFGSGVLKQQTKTNIMFLYNHIKKDRIVLRLHQFPLLGRIIITDKCVLFTPMLKNKYIRRNKIYKYAVGGEMYCYYDRLFDQIWDSAEDLKSIIKKQNSKKTL